MTASFDQPHLQLLSDLCRAIGVSGDEAPVAEVIRAALGDSVDRIWTDPMGNLYALREGQSERRLMLDAHMDEIGLMIQHIDAGGFLHFDLLGGWDERILPAQMVLIRVADGRLIPGIIGSQPPHILQASERKGVMSASELFIDIGAESAAEVAAMGVRMGDYAVVTSGHDSMLLGKNRFAARALDNRVGCATAIMALRELADETPELTIVAAFPVGEEVGLRGATVAARVVDPDVALILEGTVAADVPGVATSRQPAVQGLGPAITLADKRQIVPRRLVEFMERIAREADIPVQRKRPGFGGTDGGAVHMSGSGPLTGVLSCPCRYIHSPMAHLLVSDYEHMIRMTGTFIRRAGELLSA